MLHILISIVWTSTGQVKSDTLCIGGKKYPLHKTKLFHDWQYGSVTLPSEYSKVERKLNFKYTHKSDSIIGFENDDEGNEIMTIAFSGSSSEKKGKLDYNIYGFLDTLQIKIDEFSNHRPYIKTGNNKKIYFYAAKVDELHNDTITEYKYDQINDGSIFSFCSDKERLKALQVKKQLPTYFLHDIYYVKGTATYYLKRSFTIILK